MDGGGESVKAGKPFSGGRPATPLVNLNESGSRNHPAGVIMMQKQLTAIIEREGTGYVSLCPELDIASQGDTIEEARHNLKEAVELFFEAASPEEIQQRLHEEVYVTRLEIALG